jgi:ribose transport system permease protein
MHHTAFGLRLMMHGDNPRAVRYSGISPISTTIALYVLSGGIAAIAGLITMGRVNAADPASGAMYELAAITAAVIGGSSLRGGNGSIAGAVLGTLIVGVIQNGLILLDVAPYYQQIALGVILLLASLRKDSLE